MYSIVIIIIALLGCISCMECRLAACCYQCLMISVCVCLLDITMSCAKMAESVNMPFGVWTWVGPRNYV